MSSRSPQPAFHIVTFGCQMNKLDAELLAAALARSGYRQVAEPEQADVLIYATCSVRDHAENRVLSHLGAWRARAGRDPHFVLGVVGCMAQRMGQEIVRRFPHVRLVCGTRAFLRVPGHLDRIAATGEAVVDVGEEDFAFKRDPGLRSERHHAYVSIMRGCDNYCAYCIVPYVRGPEVSRPPGEVLDEVRRLCDDGVVEVTLLGQNVNSYGKGLGGPPYGGLAGLLELLNDVPGLKRLRFVTSHPRDMSEEILQAVARLDKACEHLHVPPQSGSDSVLKRMRRGYDRTRYLELVRRARHIIPAVELSGDFLVGFPGETEADFEQSLSLLREVRFQQSFIFKYSPRPGTLAARRPDDVPEAAKRERNQRMLDAQAQVDEQRRGAMVGRVVEVLVDGANPAGAGGRRLSGRTRGGDIVFFSDPAVADPEAAGRMAGELCRVRLTGATPLTLFGERCD